MTNPILLATILLGTSQGSPKLDSFDTVVNKFLKETQVPGVAIIVKDKGKVLVSKGYGFADLEQRKAMTVDSVHELASVSKQFTAAAILLLAEQGKLALTDTLDKFVEDAPEAWKKITVNHLLEHTSGLPDYLSDESVIRKDGLLRNIVRDLRAKPVRFEPGEKWEYSNTGYLLLGYIVLKVGGKEVGPFCEEHLLKPAGMKTARTNDPLAIVPNRATGYSKPAKTLQKEDYTSRTYSATGDGHLMASAKDLLAWSEAIRANKILNPASWKQMRTMSAQSRKEPTKGVITGYGKGLGVMESNGTVTVNHSGGWLGTTTFLQTSITKPTTIIIMMNSDFASFAPLLKEIEARLKSGKF